MFQKRIISSLLPAQFNVFSFALESSWRDLKDSKQCIFTGKLRKAVFYYLYLTSPKKPRFPWGRARGVQLVPGRGSLQEAQREMFCSQPWVQLLFRMTKLTLKLWTL